MSLAEQLRGGRRRLETEMGPRPRGGAASPRGALEQSPLQEIGLVDVLDRVRLLPHRDGQRGEADGPAAEVPAQAAEDVAVEAVEPLVVDLEQVERRLGDL